MDEGAGQSWRPITTGDVAIPQIDVYADLNKRELNQVGLAIFKVWSDWALGRRTLAGRYLKQPTGTYANALRVVQEKGHVAVIVDEGAAPHARILETGHGPVDMRQYLNPGQRYAIKGSVFKPGAGPQRFAFLDGQRTTRRGSGRLIAGQFVPSVTGIVRAPTARSKLRPTNTSGRGPAWTIPPMPAYAPARLIARMFANRVASQGGTIIAS